MKGEPSGRIVSIMPDKDGWRTDPPGALEVNREETVTFSSATDSGGVDARVWMPNPAVFGPGNELIELGPHNGWRAEVLVDKNAPLGDQDYAFYAVSDRKLAEDQSPPKMKIGK